MAVGGDKTEPMGVGLGMGVDPICHLLISSKTNFLCLPASKILMRISESRGVKRQ